MMCSVFGVPVGLAMHAVHCSSVWCLVLGLVYIQIFFWGSRSAAGSCDTDAQGLGALKSLKHDNIHKIRTPKIQEFVFSEVAEAPQAAATHMAGRPWNRQTKSNRHVWHVSKIHIFQTAKLEMLKCAWEHFLYVGKSRYGNTKQERTQIMVWAPHSYQLGSGKRCSVLGARCSVFVFRARYSVLGVWCLVFGLAMNAVHCSSVRCLVFRSSACLVPYTFTYIYIYKHNVICICYILYT